MTAMTRWSPTAPLFSRHVDRLFNDFLSDLPTRFAGEAVERGAWVPAIDVRETEESLMLDAELPGMSKDDIDLSIENNLLTLAGERKFENEENRESYHRIERGYGRFTRSFTLPAAVDASKVQAKFKDGVLSIVLPKTELAKARRIEIG